MEIRLADVGISAGSFLIFLWTDVGQADPVCRSGGSVRANPLNSNIDKDS